jgi:hypothetical protein
MPNHASPLRLRQTPGLCRLAVQYQGLESVNTSLQYLYFGILCYGIGFTFTKISILTQYKRIFSVQATPIPIYIVMGLCISGGIAAHFAFMFSCLPIDAFWNLLKRPEAKCINIEK